MELYLLRHGLAGQYGDPPYKDDSQRPLTQEGRQKMRNAAQGMQNLGLKFDIILSSPFLRAKQTAQIVANSYKIKSIHLTNCLLPPASANQLLKEIIKDFPKAKSVLAVGHEPHLTTMIAELLQGNNDLNIDFKKGGLCNLEILEANKRFKAKLIWLLTSKQLSLLGKK